jgi:hypothetical protein
LVGSPFQLKGVSAVEQFSNNPSTTLTNSGGISSSATSLTVASGGPFPSSGTFRIIIDGEIIQVTAVSGTTWTIVRGDGGSIAATHAQGANIYGILTAEALNSAVTVQSAGTEVSDRRVLNFVSGATVADNSGSGRCDITISGGSGPLDYPYGTLTYGRPRLFSIKNTAVAAGATLTLLDTTGGSPTPGYIDQFWIGINDDAVDTDAREKSTLSFFRDGETSASLVIQTGLLMGLYWGPAGFTSRYLGALTYNTGGGGSNSGSGFMAHKIPWTESMKIVFTNGDTTNGIGLFADISYKTGASINWGSAAHFLAGTAGPVSVAAYSVNTLLNISGTGIFYGLVMYFEGGDGNYNYLEGAFSIYIDGETSPSLVWSGTEDYFLQGEFFNDGVLYGDNAGCTGRNSGLSQVGAYRFHLDDPIPFTTSIKVTWNCGNSAVSTVTNNVTIWYAALYYLNA